MIVHGVRGFRSDGPSSRAVTNLGLRLHGHWDRHPPHIYDRICFRDIDKSFAEQRISLENYAFCFQIFLFRESKYSKHVKYSAEHGESITPAWTKTHPAITISF
jgi:hypothetical protein